MERAFVAAFVFLQIATPSGAAFISEQPFVDDDVIVNKGGAVSLQEFSDDKLDMSTTKTGLLVGATKAADGRKRTSSARRLALKPTFSGVAFSSSRSKVASSRRRDVVSPSHGVATPYVDRRNFTRRHVVPKQQLQTKALVHKASLSQIRTKAPTSKNVARKQKVNRIAPLDRRAQHRFETVHKPVQQTAQRKLKVSFQELESLTKEEEELDKVAKEERIEQDEPHGSEKAALGAADIVDHAMESKVAPMIATSQASRVAVTPVPATAFALAPEAADPRTNVTADELIDKFPERRKNLQDSISSLQHAESWMARAASALQKGALIEAAALRINTSDEVEEQVVNHARRLRNLIESSLGNIEKANAQVVKLKAEEMVRKIIGYVSSNSSQGLDVIAAGQAKRMLASAVIQATRGMVASGVGMRGEGDVASAHSEDAESESQEDNVLTAVLSDDLDYDPGSEESTEDDALSVFGGREQPSELEVEAQDEGVDGQGLEEDFSDEFVPAALSQGA